MGWGFRDPGIPGSEPKNEGINGSRVPSFVGSEGMGVLGLHPRSLTARP